ncbi:MAG TPA: 5-(carboxyamino)imidazole ribonucleotide mutase, partial [Lachnoclostridium sp.]|nr:5-(carboxyamino)imidazole ribonucleotide mutase [Lachnoclostridium sp.]
YSEEMKAGVEKKDKKLQKEGYKAFLK